MNKYIAIHKIINLSIFMLFPIAGYFILTHNVIRNGFYGIVLLVLNIIEISIFIIFALIASKCEWGTRKQHAVLKCCISLLAYIGITVLTVISI